MTRLEMEAVINAGGTVVWNGRIYYTVESLPTQEEIDELTDPPEVGPEGLSAYEVAVTNGFSGTEEEWLDSLVGPQGEQGIQGIQGEPGEDGTGDMNGPASSVDNNIAVFDGTTGKLLKDGGATVASLATDAELTSGLAGKQDSLGFTPVPNTRTVNGHALSADVTVTKSDVSLGNVDNTSDANKPVSTAQQTALDLKANDDAVVHDTGDETIAGVKTFSSDPIIPDEAYDATAWNGSLEPPTKNAIRDKLETMSGANVQEFSSSGTWTKPSGAKFVLIKMWGAGGGGGGGARRASPTASFMAGGGAGGNGGSYIEIELDAAVLGATESVTIGTGGAGGAGASTDNTGGSNGSAGTDTSFGTTVYMVAKAGNGGTGGGTTGGGGAASQTSPTIGGNNVTPSDSASKMAFFETPTADSGGSASVGHAGATPAAKLSSLLSKYKAATGGGGGGSTTVTPGSFAGTGSIPGKFSTTNGAGGNAGAGSTGGDFLGGGGGGANTSGTGFNGGNGGPRGGGGGGAGGGTAGGGTGGTGGNGYVSVISW